MVRIKKHNNVEFIIVDTDIVVYEGEEVSKIVPVQVQVRLKDLSEKQQRTIYKHAAMYFDRTLNINKPQPEVKKGWFSRWFSK
jgi:hypothetical protein